MKEEGKEEKGMEVRDYASKEQISLGTVYRRIWEGRVRATKRYGRWVISSDVCRHDHAPRVT